MAPATTRPWRRAHHVSLTAPRPSRSARRAAPVARLLVASRPPQPRGRINKKPLSHEFVVRFNQQDCVRSRLVENYLGHFLEKLQKIWKKYKRLPAKGAREARPFVAEAWGREYVGNMSACC